MPIHSRSLALSTLVALIPAACNEHPLKPVDLERSQVDRDERPIAVNRKVDVLFVIDNSGSMGEEQATLARNFGAFVDALEAVDADYRIAVTTTDSGNRFGCVGTEPEGGHFVATSCRDRLPQFTAAGQDGENVQGIACEAVCRPELAGLATLPTRVEGSDDVKPRPWIERRGGVTNLPEGVAPSDAFGCFGPQGIDGCGFEAPLESMYRALVLAGQDNASQFGFLRDDALLAVVFVTDELDCSVTPEGLEIFDPAGTRALWNDDHPNSSVCWVAGVQCEPDAQGTHTCTASDFAADGTATDPEHAVLHPISRYIDLLKKIEARKQERLPDAQVIVSVIGGVPIGYEVGAPLTVQLGSGTPFEHDFGAAPGCQSAAGQAVPPVRLKEVADAFAVAPFPSMFSVCNDDYTDALRSIGQLIEQRLHPACGEACPVDDDPGRRGLQPACVFEQVTSAGTIAVPLCVDDGHGTPGLPEGADLCVAVLTGDARDPECKDAGAPIELDVVERPGTAQPEGATLFADCLLPAEPPQTCG